MNKWLLIIVAIIGSVWFFKFRHVANESPSVPSMGQLKYDKALTEERCGSLGGHMVEGLGCVKDSSPADQSAFCQQAGGREVEGVGCVRDVSPADMRAHCEQTGARYVESVNGCEVTH